MATYSKQLLSGSTNGRGKKIHQTATAGDTVHTAPAGTTSYDEVWLWASNTGTTARKLTVEFGGVTPPDDNLVDIVPAQSGKWICEGLIVQNGLAVKVFCDVADKVSIFGYVNRIVT